MFASPTGYMVTSFGFPFLNWGILYNSSNLIGNFPAISNFNRLSNSTGSSVSNRRFFPIIGPQLTLSWVGILDRGSPVWSKVEGLVLVEVAAFAVVSTYTQVLGLNTPYGSRPWE
jgi:hypothetical protein